MGATILGTITIPPQLHNKQFRFLLLRHNGKEAIEKDWQNTHNYQFDDPKLLDHLANGGNYGIIGGYGNLVLLDADSPEVTRVGEEKLPSTFTVKTGSPESYKKHYYFITEKKLTPIRLHLKGDKPGSKGDVRSTGQYVVAPNCIHPSGGVYTVCDEEKEVMPLDSNYLLKVLNDNFFSLDENAGTKEPSVFPVITTKKLSPYVRSCQVPDYCLENTLPEGTSKQYELFPMIADILYRRNVLDSVYIQIAKQQYTGIGELSDTQIHGSIAGWKKMGESGKLAKYSCEKMRNYLVSYHNELADTICEGCPLFESIKKKQAKELRSQQAKGRFANAINHFFDMKNLAEQAIKIQPFFYDKAKLLWMWNFESYRWERIDETDILNMISNVGRNVDTIASKERNEILEAIKQVGRENIPKQANKLWVQFKNKIVDIKTGTIIDATPDYFMTNPIPWELGKTEETPIIDKLFTEWVGEEKKLLLYQIIAYCMLSDYPIHRAFCFHGSGSNGKSKCLGIINYFIGEYNSISTELETLVESRFEQAKLYKKLVCFMGELNFSILSKTARFKRLTGEDKIPFEIKHKDPFDDYNYAKILIATNNLPETTDKSDGYYRRWVVIDFINQFKEGKNVLDTIPNIEYNNLALKSIRILKELLESKEFHGEGDIIERKKRYEEKSNPLQRFWDENVEETTEGEIYKFEFEKRLYEWCKSHNFRIVNESEIAAFMIKKKIQSAKVTTPWWIDENDPQKGKKRYNSWVDLRWKR